MKITLRTEEQKVVEFLLWFVNHKTVDACKTISRLKEISLLNVFVLGEQARLIQSRSYEETKQLFPAKAGKFSARKDPMIPRLPVLSTLEIEHRDNPDRFLKTLLLDRGAARKRLLRLTNPKRIPHPDDPTRHAPWFNYQDPELALIWSEICPRLPNVVLAGGTEYKTGKNTKSGKFIGIRLRYKYEAESLDQLLNLGIAFLINTDYSLITKLHKCHNPDCHKFVLTINKQGRSNMYCDESCKSAADKLEAAGRMAQWRKAIDRKAKAWADKICAGKAIPDDVPKTPKSLRVSVKKELDRREVPK
jgi:hypothetical protein